MDIVLAYSTEKNMKQIQAFYNEETSIFKFSVAFFKTDIVFHVCAHKFIFFMLKIETHTHQHKNANI